MEQTTKVAGIELKASYVPRVLLITVTPEKEFTLSDCGESGIYIGKEYGNSKQRIDAIKDAVQSNRTVLIEDIEAGVHYTQLREIWKAIRNSVCRVIATTQSYECIEEASDAFLDAEETDLFFVRLSEGNNGHYTKHVLETALRFNMDVR